MMSKITLLAVVFSSYLMAAVPKLDNYASSDRDMEVLSLPIGNQKRILKSDKRTVDKFISAAQDTSLALDLRWKAIMALGFLETQNANPSYLALASSKEWFVKNGLMIAMDENNHPQKFFVAKKFIKDPSLIVRSTAFDILMQDSTHRDLLWEELFSNQNVKKSRSLWVRPKIIRHMSQNPRSYERGLFERLSKEKEPEIVTLANQGLNKINSMSSSTQLAPIKSKTF